MHERRRQSDDEVVNSLEKMLAEESDSEVRMRLLVLYRIAVMLVDTIHVGNITRTEVKELNEKISTHIERQQQTSNKILGGAKVISIVFIVVQSIFGYVATKFLDQHQYNTVQIHKLVDKVERLETSVFGNATKKSDNMTIQ